MQRKLLTVRIAAECIYFLALFKQNLLNIFFITGKTI